MSQAKPFLMNPDQDGDFQKILEKTPHSTIAENLVGHLHWAYRCASFLKQRNGTLFKSSMATYQVDKKVSCM
jgi:hypothetical protein